MKEIGFTQSLFFFYLLGVLACSVMLSYFNLFGFISTCISIIVLFGVGIFIPLSIYFNSDVKALN
ncbi:MAG: hypothetical protein J7L95_07330, partial [Prolixibacteraceae bacterium]|nr:hypothetical protein [Prolixibacteraceae bacterium]